MISPEVYLSPSSAHRLSRLFCILARSLGDTNVVEIIWRVHNLETTFCVFWREGDYSSLSCTNSH